MKPAVREPRVCDARAPEKPAGAIRAVRACGDAMEGDRGERGGARGRGRQCAVGAGGTLVADAGRHLGRAGAEHPERAAAAASRVGIASAGRDSESSMAKRSSRPRGQTGIPESWGVACRLGLLGVPVASASPDAPRTRAAPNAAASRGARRPRRRAARQSLWRRTTWITPGTSPAPLLGSGRVHPALTSASRRRRVALGGMDAHRQAEIPAVAGKSGLRSGGGGIRTLEGPKGP